MASRPPREHTIENPESQELFQALQRALRSSKPLDLLVCVSSLLDAVDERSRTQTLELRGNPSLDQLVASFLDTEHAETTAALHVMRALHPALPLSARVDAELAARTHRIPPWIHTLPQARASLPPRTVTHGDGTVDHLLGATLDGAGTTPSITLTAAVVVDTTSDTIVDAVVLPVGLDVMVAQLERQLDDEADALAAAESTTVRASVTQAVAVTATTDPPVVTSTWPLCRPLVEWFVRLL
ncbi:MAG TPA: hypothetical protein VGE77_11370 [Nocardioides sp.]